MSSLILTPGVIVPGKTSRVTEWLQTLIEKERKQKEEFLRTVVPGWDKEKSK